METEAVAVRKIDHIIKRINCGGSRTGFSINRSKDSIHCAKPQTAKTRRNTFTETECGG